MLGDDRVLDLLDGRRIGDVEPLARDTVASGRQAGDGGLEGRGIHVGEHDRGAGFGQGLGDGKADPARRARHDGDTAVQLELFQVHGTPSRRGSITHFCS